jgi:hypothetical protein
MRSPFNIKTQFQKYRPKIAEHIRTYSDKPSVAFSESRQYQGDVRPDWHQVKIEKVHLSRRAVSYHSHIALTRWTSLCGTSLHNIST